MCFPPFVIAKVLPWDLSLPIENPTLAGVVEGVTVCRHDISTTNISRDMPAKEKVYTVQLFILANTEFARCKRFPLNKRYCL